jgi:sulfur-oxidizing protein SoxB
MIAAMVVTSCSQQSGAQQQPGEKSITFIQVGDIHGHLIPRPNLRPGESGKTQGGLARLYSVIQEIRGRREHSILVNTGDVVQGGAEAMFTQGQAMLDVLNEFGIDYFAPGNWDYVYGTERYIELFAPPKPLAPWNALAANVTYNGDPYADKTGQTVVPPYAVTTVAGVKIGILGFSSERGPTVVGPDVSKGFKYTDGDEEMAKYLPILRDTEKVDMVVVISELGEANNLRLAAAHPGIDIVLSSDMHEETFEPAIASTGTQVFEMGQDGTRVGEVTVTFNADNEITDITFTMHVVDDSVTPDQGIARLVEQVRAPFVGNTFVEHVNPINGVTLKMPIDTIIGTARVGLYRANWSDSDFPGVIEGSSHNFIADVFREEAGTDFGILRGFRYGTHIAPGDIKLEDIYHYIPVGPFVATGELTGQQIQKNVEKTLDGCLNHDTTKWTGGWQHSWSGLKYDLDPNQEMGRRITNIRAYNQATKAWEPLDPNKTYSVAGYNYTTEPNKINKLVAANVQQLGPNGEPVDATELITRYLSKHDANPETGRINILQTLPPPITKGNKEVQPLRGISN